MGNAYTTQQRVLNETFSDVSDEAKAIIPQWIEDASRLIDAALPNYRTPFADIAASPGTPPVIEEIARFLVVDRLLRKLELLRYDENGRAIETYKRDAEKHLEQLRAGALVIPEVQTPGSKPPVIMPGATSTTPARVFGEGAFSQW